MEGCVLESGKQLYEVINPSNNFTIQACEPIVAIVATLLLGNGLVYLKDIKGRTILPLLAQSEEDADTWLRRVHDIPDLTRYVGTRWREIADCLESAVIGRMGERLDLQATLATTESDLAREQILAGYLHLRRTTLNLWGKRSIAIAEGLRHKKERDSASLTSPSSTK